MRYPHQMPYPSRSERLRFQYLIDGLQELAVIAHQAIILPLVWIGAVFVESLLNDSLVRDFLIVLPVGTLCFLITIVWVGFNDWLLRETFIPAAT